MSADYQTEPDWENEIRSTAEPLAGASITQIFVQSVTLPGFEKYHERALVVGRPHDVGCVADIADNVYLRFLPYAGISPKMVT